MKKNFQSSIQLTNKRSPLIGLADLGWNPSQIKQLIIQTLDPYFEDKASLQAYAIDYLSAEAANVGVIEQDMQAKNWFSQVLNIYRAAAKIDKKACFQSLADWSQLIAHGGDEFWSAATLERDLSVLSIYDFKFEAFRMIGIFVEASIQPLLRALLVQVRISRGDFDPNKNLKTIELGKIIDELRAKFPDPEIVVPGPWHIRLNHWRNMSQHHQTRVRGEEIIGVYGVGARQTEVVLTRSEVLQFVKRLMFILGVVRGARAIFIFDNFEKAGPYFPKVCEREDTRIFQLSNGIATQGFQINSFQLIERTVQVRICDRLGGDVQKRTVHCSQFVYPIWLSFPYDAIELEFVDISGKLKMIFKASGLDLARCKEKPDPWEDLASAIKFHAPKTASP